MVVEKDVESKKVLLDTLCNSYEITFLPSGNGFLKALNENHYNLLVFDLDTINLQDHNQLNRIKSLLRYTPVIFSSQNKRREKEVLNMLNKGVSDFIVKPFSPDVMRHRVKKALEYSSMKNEIDYLRHQEEGIYNFDNIISESSTMKQVVKTLKKFSKVDSTILLTGETGTGKTFLSNALHFNSKRYDSPFIKINCTNLPENLLESELFGHEKGAFTSADKVRIGRFEQANGGTIFLDEISELTLGLQAKLLRVLDEKSFERIGSNRIIHSDVRIIVATNKNLMDLMEAGKFREDLFYRINILSLQLPPLRERRKCIEPLAYYLLDKISRTLRKKISGLHPEVVKLIKIYPWPGNIRQFANSIERASVLEETTVIQEKSFSLPQTSPQPSPQTSKLLNTELLADKKKGSMNEHEKKLIIRALEEKNWVQKYAAEELGIAKRTLSYKIKNFNITHPHWIKNKS